MLESGWTPTAGAPVGRPIRRRDGGVRRLRTVSIAGAMVLAVVATAACDTADAANQPSPPRQGGTLHVVLTQGMPLHLDPQRLNAATDANVARLFTRTLTTFKAEPGEAASEIVGDLATDTGRPSEGNRVWTFRLKDGIRWQDGSLVNCEQVKYGVERSFSDIFDTAQTYPKAFLEDNNPPYKGPFVAGNNGGKGLESVECVDTQTVRFRLKRPVGDFGYTVAMTVFAPVPLNENRQAYDRNPWSNGPYMIQTSTDKQIVLVRNPHWNKASDPVRKQYPEKIVITNNENAALVTNELVQDQGEAKSTIMLDTDVAPTFVQQVVNDPALNGRTVQGPTGAVRYFAINTRNVKDLRCRQALAYGFNKRKYRSAMGGSMFGELATSIIPPNLKAHKDFDIYGTKTNPEGQRDKAQDLLAQAKGTCFKNNKIRVAYRNTPAIRRYVSTIVDTYARNLGLEVELDPVDAETYFDKVSNIANPYDLIYAGWVADWANGSAVIPPLFDGRTLKPPGELGTNNYSFLNDPEIDRQIDEAYAEADLNRQYLLWGELDNKLQEMAVTIPILFTNGLRLAGSNVRGGFIHPQFAQPDLVALGLADPSLSPA
ncbi:MAG TPA: ABC transporter substrate-binding protein [Micromonosporaceae bacterium]|jgi:peptide/nickel transport system substrate-binding protein